MIVLENVVKKFKDYTALRGISISFEKGKIHGIIGRNGSGKTVMMKCICGLMHPDSGKITVNGKMIGKEVDIANDIGAIIEAPGFLPNYSGYRNLKFLADIKRVIGKQEIYAAMKTVGLDPDNGKHVGKYSLGMRQRLGLAQAIMENPSILILDEPMNGLDRKGVEEMRDLLVSFREQGKTVLLASHNREDIDILCDTVQEMEDGSFL
ncbi:ATP-binding cassette domain-containing protein [Neglectibacter timonensis]|jgi:ABC-2 type transport system ATP-binding protein|uniref:ATP-binding cassette domain-containing protein n=1 Tax=Oscillospiraceae TaxID=216572 RepID=UPI0039963D48